MKIRLKRSYGLRTLMLFIVGLSVWMGWRVNMARQQRVAVAAIRQHKGSVRYDWSGPPVAGESGLTPPGPAWLRRAIGDEFFQEIRQVHLMYGTPDLHDVTAKLGSCGQLDHLSLPVDGSQATDETCRDIAGCRALATLLMSGKSVTDAGIRHLEGLANLESLRINEASLTDEGLKSLKRLPRLETLDVHGSNFTEEGLSNVGEMTNLKTLSLDGTPGVLTEIGTAHLARLKNLETLMLPDSKITDAGLKELAALPRLRSLYVGKGAVSDEAREGLMAARPGLRIFVSLRKAAP